MHLLYWGNELVMVQETYRTGSNITRKNENFPPQQGEITVQAIDCDRKMFVSFPSVIQPPPPSGYQGPLTGAVPPFITGYFPSRQNFFILCFLFL